MQSRAVPTTATGATARAPPATMASPSLLLGPSRRSPWPSSGQRGYACAASAWRRRDGARVHMQVARLH
eukprot:12862975-Alexandrium_andersonii.AAC.1